MFRARRIITSEDLSKRYQPPGAHDKKDAYVLLNYLVHVASKKSVKKNTLRWLVLILYSATSVPLLIQG